MAKRDNFLKGVVFAELSRTLTAECETPEAAVLEALYQGYELFVPVQPDISIEEAVQEIGQITICAYVPKRITKAYARAIANERMQHAAESFLAFYMERDFTNQDGDYTMRYSKLTKLVQRELHSVFVRIATRVTPCLCDKVGERTYKPAEVLEMVRRWGVNNECRPRRKGSKHVMMYALVPQGRR